MTTMLDKCAVAGDITQGIDRRGVWTAAITVIGGTSSTAVKLVSSDTEDGEYTDYKTLISAADAETDLYKGFVVDLHGAKKFIKVTGAVMATAVFGDCDHDVKAIAITEGEVPSGAVLENNKTVSITENGVVEITPSAGKNGMKKVTATVNVPSDAKEEQAKSVTITENGTTIVTPDSGKVLSSVSITTNVSGGGGGGGASFFDDIYTMWMVYVSDAFTAKDITIEANDKDIYVIRCPNNTTLAGSVDEIYPTYNFIKLTPGETKVIDVLSPDSVSFTLNSENTRVSIHYSNHIVGYDNRFIVIAVNR